ncbi:hypothetical protein BN14_06141 [Rhizoctonia solani AG-1 IB]|uniref:Uncharacterized protein n=1 Tax=Thanatephorus cucumeris (strain AG1-IB / isolate 7/3/14) TaxID=1108050 RepID=M5BWS8_THACB|nr:hypothetical protein BN14_06141 [Rhizoctonia solani AG-1 IB]
MQALVSLIVMHIFKEVLLRHVPLTTLTTAYRQPNSDALRHKMEVIKWSSKGQTLVKVVANLPDAGELHMTPNQWVDAWKTWLMLIKWHQPHIAKAWHNPPPSCPAPTRANDVSAMFSTAPEGTLFHTAHVVRTNACLAAKPDTTHNPALTDP